MAYEITADELTNKVEALQEELDVFEFVNNTKLPEDTTVVYTNADAALKTAKILLAEKTREAQQEEEGLSLTDEFEDESTSEEELDALHNDLVASGLTFHMKGLAPKAFEALQNHIKATHPYKEGDTNEEYSLALNNELVARSIVKVVSVDGKVRTRSWTPEEVDDFTTNLYAAEANKLYFKAQELSYIMDIFDRAVSADFS